MHERTARRQYVVRLCKSDPPVAGKIPEQFIDDLLSRVDIVDVIEADLPLKKSGKDFHALCPFHGEKTPSFTVSQENSSITASAAVRTAARLVS